MVKLGALWVKKDDNGKPYFTGKLGEANCVLYKNDYKKEEKHPDYVLYVTQPKKKATEKKEQTDDFGF